MFGKDIERFCIMEPYEARRAVEFIDDGPIGIIIRRCDGDLYSYDFEERVFMKLPDDPNNLTLEECRDEYSRRLRKIMSLTGVSQLELSDRTGIAQPAISNYVNGRVLPNFYAFDKIAKALGYSSEVFRYNL